MSSNYEIESSLDPRDVLSYLNELGIRNVDSSMLKEFIKDLKKLIRLDQQNRNTKCIDDKENTSRGGPERLHSCSTYSSRCKSVNANEQRRRPVSSTISEVESRSVNMKINVCKRASSAKICERPGKIRTTSAPLCDKNKQSSNNIGSAKLSNLIKVPIPERAKKSDPVALYHYYNSLWEKYKSNLPGENSWADLRWSVRERLLGAAQEKPKVMSAQSKEMLAKRREGWVD